MITQERLRQVAQYNEQTGEFIRIQKVKGKRAGQVMGSRRHDGYIRIRIDKHFFYGHRLAWFWCTNIWPEGEIDHIDGNPANNAIANLRPVAREVNQQNIRKAQSNNATGLLGVCLTSKGDKFRATITVNKTQIYLGTFPSPEEAHVKYLEAKRRLHEGCTI